MPQQEPRHRAMPVAARHRDGTPYGAENITPTPCAWCGTSFIAYSARTRDEHKRMHAERGGKDKP